MTQLGLLQVFNEELCMRAETLVISRTDRIKDIEALILQVDAHREVMPTFGNRVIGCEFLEHGKHHLHKILGKNEKEQYE